MSDDDWEEAADAGVFFKKISFLFSIRVARKLLHMAVINCPLLLFFLKVFDVHEKEALSRREREEEESRALRQAAENARKKSLIEQQIVNQKLERLQELKYFSFFSFSLLHLTIFNKTFNIRNKQK